MQTRRGFLKLVGAASTALPVASAGMSLPLAAEALEPARVKAKRTPLEMVNVLQGTESSLLFSRGNTLPLIAMPFGMNHWSMQSAAGGSWFFQPADRRIVGIRCTHQLSPWLSDYGYATFLPVCGELNPGAEQRASSYRPEDATLHPHFMDLTLLRYLTRVELTPTERCAAMRITYGRPDAALIVDLPGSDAQIEKRGGRIYATVRANSGGAAEGFAAYYVLDCDHSFGEPSVDLRDGHCVARIPFRDASPGKPVILKIATSYLSHKQAERNLQNEVAEKSFDSLVSSGRSRWEEHLGRAVVEGGREEQQIVFYSAMYRALLFPHIWHEYDENGNPVHWSPYNGKPAEGVMYADHGYWDVYRAWYPWMSILFPERLGEILQAWVNAAQEGGWLPQFPCPGYRACMTGSLIDAVFADAAVKRIKGFDLERAYGYLKKHASQPGDPARGFGRLGIEDYLRLGYVSTATHQSVAETADAAYGDFCIAQVAQVLGHDQDRAAFEKRSQNWRNLYDPSVRFLRGKQADGSWMQPFDPIRWGDPYVEGSAWQHRWDVPHDPEGLIAAMGGGQYVAAELEKMLTQPPAFEVGAYGGEIHEMSEMAAVPFGQYAHSNQPVHHVLYLFAIAGRSDRLQYWVRRVMTELYAPDTFAGDEDTGSMSAWFLMSAMGFYPFCPGRAEYVLGSPLFDRVTLKLPNGKICQIIARNNSPENIYVADCRVNGLKLQGVKLAHSQIEQGAVIEFTMTCNSRHN